MLLLNSNFITMHQRPLLSYTSRTYSIVWCIPVDAFVDALRTDVMDFEYYFGTLHKHPLDDEEWETILCPRCSTHKYQSRHNSFACPKLTYMPLRKLIVYRDLRSRHDREQQRVPYFIRRKNYQFKTSILKYYRSYFQVLSISKSLLEEEQNYLMNFFPKRHFANYYTLNEILAGKSRDRGRHEGENGPKKVFEVDVPDNFEFYFPHFNICNLVADSVMRFHGRVRNGRPDRHIPKTQQLS